MSAGAPLLRPSDLALLLLASGDLLPRQRARDQQADLAGAQLKRQVLQLLVELDPEPEQLEAALLRIVKLIGPPYGPTRALCISLHEEWLAVGDPQLAEWLLGQALEASARQPGDHPRRRRPRP